jgi:predicted metal-dependent HD superfamily phosphohydrolase
MDEVDLADIWAGAWSQLGVPARTCQNLFEDLHHRYAEPQRRYHTLKHVQHFVTVARRFVPPAALTPAFILACFWHDIVYDTTRNDNEEKSAELARKWLQECEVEEPVTEDVAALILATKKHDALDGALAETSSYFLDCDMCILGVDNAGYRDYASAIREEYSAIPEEVFNEGRAHFLQKTLERPSIFLTEPFQQRFEQQARENLQAELDYLSNGSQP